MSKEKKFLDYEGVKYLWSKINMQDYPNNQTLIDVINAIDETKADKNDLDDYVKNSELFNEDNIIKQNVLPDGYPYASYDIILPETTLEVDVDSQQAVVIDRFILAAELSYDVTYNGTTYSCVSQALEIEGIQTIALGNVALFGGEESEEPFGIVNFDDNIAAAMGAYGFIFATDGSETITISISGMQIQKMSSAFMPALDVVTNIVNGSNIGSVRSLSAAKDDGEYTIGTFATAFGYGTKASGDSSHAEGENTTASSDSSHAEGSITTASGYSSHAEGNNTTASGQSSHAEGGNTTASGYSSHAEGNNTTASGDSSHAEGSNTTASGYSSHVQGKYNIEDTNNKYAHIVGNGNSINRSNAHTLDWDGNAWYAGDIKVGGTSYNDGSEVALKSDIENLNYLPLTGGTLLNTSTSERIPVLTIQNTHKDKASDVVIDNEGVVSCNALQTKPHGWAILSAKDESTDELLASLQLNRNTHEFIIREYCIDNPDYCEGYYLPAPDNDRTYNGVYDILTTKNQVTIEQGGTGAKNATDALKNFGLTATASELNYCDGVTSNIQTQIDGKVPTSRTVNGKALSSNISLSASDVGADASGTASNLITSHNTNTGAHADIRAQINQLSSEIADKMQLEPSYANSIEECIDTSKIYVLPDGYLYAYMSTFENGALVPLFTNQLPLATSLDGSIYNSKGYKENIRISVSSGSIEERAESPWYATGFIPVESKAVVRLKNVVMKDDDVNDPNARVAIYYADANKGLIGNSSATDLVASSGTTTDSDGNVTEFKVWSNNNIAYVRIVCQYLDENSIITVNEEILYGSSGSEGNTSPTYTNRLPLATNPDGSIYDTDGYKESTRISVSSGSFEDKTETGWCTTGLIPAKEGDIVRLKNCTFTVSTTAGTHRCGVWGADSNGSFITGKNSMITDIGKENGGWNRVFDSSGDNIIQFTIPSWFDNEYIRIVAQEFTSKSIITVNEEIVYSGGKNLLDEAGYVEGKRLSQSGGYSESDQSGVYLTGYIPISIGDTLCFENMSIPQIFDTGYDQHLYLFDNNKTGLGHDHFSDYDDQTSGIISTVWETVDGVRYLKQFTFKGGTWDGIAYNTAAFIRINATHIDETSVIFKKDMSSTTYEWKNTGRSFVTTDYEDRVIKCETRVNSFNTIINSNTSKINTALDRITTLEQSATNDNNIPSYWQSHLDERVDDIREAMESAGRNKSAFLWYSDVHWNYGSQMSPKLLNYLYKHTPINKVNFGGDIVNNESTTLTDRETMKYLWDWRNAIRNLPNHHSVVGNHDDGNTTNNLFPSNYIYTYLLASEECPEIVHGGDFYYYIDDKCENTRYLYLDTAYKCYSNSDAAQTAFVKESLKSTPAGWHIVAISHIWVQMDYTVSPAVPKGFSAPAKALLDIFDAYNARTGEFSSCGAKVEFCIGGHTHVDLDRTSTGGIPVIITETDSRHIRSGSTYTDGTITESSINAIVADYNNNIINVIRIGRGNSRTISI